MEPYAPAEASYERLFSLIEKNWALNRDVALGAIENEVDEAIRAVRAEPSDPATPQYRVS